MPGLPGKHLGETRHNESMCSADIHARPQVQQRRQQQDSTGADVAQWLYRDFIASWKLRDDTAQPPTAMRDYISNIKAYYEGLPYPRDLAASWR